MNIRGGEVAAAVILEDCPHRTNQRGLHRVYSSTARVGSELTRRVSGRMRRMISKETYEQSIEWEC